MRLVNTAIASAVGLFMTPVMANDMESKAKEAVEDAQTAVYDIIDKDITTIEFKTGESALSDANNRDLRSLVKSVRDDSKVESIIVATWADEDHPADKEVELSEAQQELAEKRAENVSKELKDVGASDIEVVNMAKHSNWLETAFHFDEAQIKKAMHNEKIEDRTTASIAKALQDNGGTSKVVVLVKRELSAAAH